MYSARGYRLVLFGLAIFLLFIFSVSIRSDADTASDTKEAVSKEEGLYRNCKDAYTKGNFSESARYAKEFISAYPQSKYAGEVSFIQAFLQPNIYSSIEMHKNIIEKYPNSKWAGKSHFQLGQHYYLQGKYSDALKHYGEIVISFVEDESYWEARYWRCKSFLALGEYKKAMDALRSLENSSYGEKNRDLILMSLGECYAGMKEYQNAASAYQSLIDVMQVSHRIPSAYILLADSFQRIGKVDEAKTAYLKVVNDYGKSIEAYQARQCLDVMSKTQGKTESSKPSAQQTQPSSVQIRWYGDKESDSEFFYSVQIGAFSTKTVADSVADRLRKKDYTVEVITPAADESPKLYKVRVGKFRTRYAAQDLAERLKRDEGIDSYFVYPIE